MRCAVMYIKADLGEQPTSLGFPSPTSRDDPCLGCRIKKGDYLNALGASVQTLPDARKTNADLDTACRACEYEVDLGPGDLQQLTS